MQEPSTEEGFTLADLTEMYRLGHHLSSKSRDFAALVRREVVRLQQGVQSRVQVWEQVCVCIMCVPMRCFGAGNIVIVTTLEGSG